eukprot:15347049-Ditylum_brightwellii.AAC.1
MPLRNGITAKKHLFQVYKELIVKRKRQAAWDTRIKIEQVGQQSDAVENQTKETSSQFMNATLNDKQKRPTSKGRNHIKRS